MKVSDIFVTMQPNLKKMVLFNLFRDGGEKPQKSQVAGFSKFEEKKRQQSDKKRTLMKLNNMFRKTTTAKGW